MATYKCFEMKMLMEKNMPPTSTTDNRASANYSYLSTPFVLRGEAMPTMTTMPPPPLATPFALNDDQNLDFQPKAAGGGRDDIGAYASNSTERFTFPTEDSNVKNGHFGTSDERPVWFNNSTSNATHLNDTIRSNDSNDLERNNNIGRRETLPTTGDSNRRIDAPFSNGHFRMDTGEDIYVDGNGCNTLYQNDLNANSNATRVRNQQSSTGNFFTNASPETNNVDYAMNHGNENPTKQNSNLQQRCDGWTEPGKIILKTITKK